MFPTNKPSLLGKLAVMLLGSLLITPVPVCSGKIRREKISCSKNSPLSF